MLVESVKCIVYSVKSKAMITALLFLLMIALPTPAAAESQAWGEEQQILAPGAQPVQTVMTSPNASNGLMQSGSKYSSTVVYQGEYNGGTYDGQAPHPGQPRKTNGWPDIPFPDPIGDAMIPLALLACAYLLYRFARKRALKRE